MQVPENHPRQRVFFYVEGRLKEKAKDAFAVLARELVGMRKWTLDPPRPFDVSGQDSALADQGFVPPEAVGLSMEVYSALPPVTLPKEIDQQHLDEVRTVIAKLCEFSQANRVNFEVGLDERFVGSITRGNMDRTLSEGLLGEWERHLNALE